MGMVCRIRVSLALPVLWFSCAVISTILMQHRQRVAPKQPMLMVTIYLVMGLRVTASPLTATTQPFRVPQVRRITPLRLPTRLPEPLTLRTQMAALRTSHSLLCLVA